MDISTRIIITMGDPSGVGPEVVCRALESYTPAERAHLAVAGNRDVLERARALVGASFSFGDGVGEVELLPIAHNGAHGALVDGVPTSASGEMAFQCIAQALGVVQRGEYDVIVTAPISKEALHMAEHFYDGHTGMLRDMTGSPYVYMLLASPKLSTIHVTTHVSLGQATTDCVAERIERTIRAGHDHLRQIGIANPRLAVAGLNPHAGENGLFGREEIEEITPAIEAASRDGINVVGPISGDTVFRRAVHGEFDLVVAQYHDQGHIPTKLIAFDEAVNVTLGLPIARTSVDHGTAFDIAWQGVANHENMLCAINYAQRVDEAS